MLKLYSNIDEFCEKNNLTLQEAILYLESKLAELRQLEHKNKGRKRCNNRPV